MNHADKNIRVKKRGYMTEFITKEQLNQPIILDKQGGLYSMKCLECEGIFYAPAPRAFCSSAGTCSGQVRHDEQYLKVKGTKNTWA